MVSGLAVATDSYCVDHEGNVRRAFVPLDSAYMCLCGEGVWVGSDPPFPAEVLYRNLKFDATEELVRHRILQEGKFHGFVH